MIQVQFSLSFDFFLILCRDVKHSFFSPSIKGKIFRHLGHKRHLCSKYFLKAMIRISLALWNPGKTQCALLSRPGIVFKWPCFPSLHLAERSVQYVQYCLAAASLLTRVSCTSGLATGGLGPWNTVWVEFSTWCLVWPCPCNVLPDLQTHPWMGNILHAVVKEL